MRRFQVLSLTPEIDERAQTLVTSYSLSKGLRLADAIIAATAIEHALPLISKKQKDFRFLDKAGLQLLTYPTT